MLYIIGGGGRMQNSIRALRTEGGVSQRELAEALGVSRQTVNSIETGRYDPSLPLAIAIARHFGRAVEEIFHAS
ncbi:putative transcriptional regulator [Arthrobacter agilis]|nr:putative transcriptional regulator [Arthrobacter agilis]